MIEQVKLSLVTYQKLLKKEQEYDKLQEEYNKAITPDADIIQDLWKLFTNIYQTSEHIGTKQILMNLTQQQIEYLVTSLNLKTVCAGTFKFEGKTFVCPTLKKFIDNGIK